MREVLETARSVVQKSTRVRIEKQALNDFCRKLIDNGIRVPAWDSLYHFYDGGEGTVSYLLVLDSINFCFWPPPGEPRWEIKHQSEKLSGYYALAVSLKNAINSGVPITRAGYLAGLTPDELKRILGGHGELQLMDRRHRILNELGLVVLRAGRSVLSSTGKHGCFVRSLPSTVSTVKRLLKLCRLLCG